MAKDLYYVRGEVTDEAVRRAELTSRQPTLPVTATVMDYFSIIEGCIVRGESSENLVLCFCKFDIFPV